MAHVQSEISSAIWAEEFNKGESADADKSMFSQKFIISKDDDFLN